MLYMQKKVILPLVTIATCFLATSVIASHEANIGTIDAIDHTFPSGGGTYAGALSDGIDDAWIVFAATAGDNLEIDIGVISQCRDAVLLEDTTDGNFAVGDILDITDFGGSHLGEGTELTVLAEDSDFCSDGNLDFMATYTGQYAIAIGGYNNSECCDYSVTISGNVGTVAAAPPAIPSTPVPTMSVYGLMLTTLGLLLIATRRLLSKKIKAE